MERENMKEMKKHLLWTLFGSTLVLMVIGGCNLQTVRTYKGESQPLEQVAVLITDAHTCPIISMDQEFSCLSDKPGREYHLLPGDHTIQFLWQSQGAQYKNFDMKKESLAYTFEAGHVYSLLKTAEPMETADEYRMIPWTPKLEDHGTAVAFAQQHPDYYKSSTDWKKLRADNGLTRKFLGVFTIAVDPEDQPQSF
jgi:hypothetical protein